MAIGVCLNLRLGLFVMGLAGAAAAQQDAGMPPAGVYTLQQVSSELYADAHQGESQDFRLVTREAQHGDSQWWELKPAGGSIYRIQQRSTRRFLDAHQQGEFTAVTREEQENRSQLWILARVGDNRFRVQQLSSRRYLDAPGGAERDRIVTRPERHSPAQIWVIVRVSPTN